MSQKLTKEDREHIDALVEALESNGAALDDIQIETASPLFSRNERAIEFAFRGQVVYRSEESKEESKDE